MHEFEAILQMLIESSQVATFALRLPEPSVIESDRLNPPNRELMSQMSPMADVRVQTMKHYY